MRRIDLGIQVKGEDGNPIGRTVAAYIDKRCPGLAIHAAWETDSKEWQVAHVQSGLAVASLITKTDAIAAMLEIGAIQNWNRPREDVVPAEPGEWRWLKVRITTIVKKYRGEA